MLDIAGQQFGRLTAIRPSTGRKWLALCSCGSPDGLLEVDGYNLRKLHTQSCGCLRREVSRRAMTAIRRDPVTHGHNVKRTASPTYKSWQMMRQRCLNVNAPDYRYYGGRDITICEHWNRFENFLADMGIRPEGKTLDRINSNGNYEPANCRWATSQEQAENRRH